MDERTEAEQRYDAISDKAKDAVSRISEVIAEAVKDMTLCERACYVQAIAAHLDFKTYGAWLRHHKPAPPDSDEK